MARQPAAAGSPGWGAFSSSRCMNCLTSLPAFRGVPLPAAVQDGLRKRVNGRDRRQIVGTGQARSGAGIATENTENTEKKHN